MSENCHWCADDHFRRCDDQRESRMHRDGGDQPLVHEKALDGFRLMQQ